MAKRRIAVFIEANGRYCNNDCPFMSNDAKRCKAFDEPLFWKTGKLTNGNIRLDKCRRAELVP